MKAVWLEEFGGSEVLVTADAPDPVPGPGQALIEVTDDGIGGADFDGGTGLSGLADRLAALDGTLVVESPPGRGTRIRAAIPVA